MGQFLSGVYSFLIGLLFFIPSLVRSNRSDRKFNRLLKYGFILLQKLVNNETYDQLKSEFSDLMPGEIDFIGESAFYDKKKDVVVMPKTIKAAISNTVGITDSVTAKVIKGNNKND